MKDENHDIPQESLPDAFANKFENKIINIQNISNIDKNVYNGTRKMTSNNEDFMTELDILEHLVHKIWMPG